MRVRRALEEGEEFPAHLESQDALDVMVTQAHLDHQYVSDYSYCDIWNS
jgi:hypothetical protein